jgi:hypothetical protein
MQSESTDDPEFNWWEEPVQMYNYAVSDDISSVATTFDIVSGGLMLKPGDMLRVYASGEVIRVVTVISDTSITVTRAVGPGGTRPALPWRSPQPRTAKLLYIGSAYREGAPRSVGVSFNPTQQSNVTQIFRDPVESRVPRSKTKFRTGDPQKNDKRRALHKHSLGIERAFWLGTRYETVEAASRCVHRRRAEPHPGCEHQDRQRRRDGYGRVRVLSGGHVRLRLGREAGLWLARLRWSRIGALVRKNSMYQWGPNEKEYGMQMSSACSARPARWS